MGLPRVTTNSFLRAFKPQPAKGNITANFPMGGRELVAPLIDKNADEVRVMIRSVVSEAQEVRDNLAKWGRKLPHPLVATASDWTLYPSLYRVDEPYKDAFVFKGPMGQHVAFHDDPKRIKVGWSGKLASCYQGMDLTPDRGDEGEHVYTNNYAMVFRGGGLKALDTYLGLEAPSLSERVLAVANRVYFSEQFPPEHLLDPIEMSYMYSSGKWDKDTLTLTRKWGGMSEGKWDFRDDASALIKNARSYMVSLSHEQQGDFGTVPLYIDGSEDRLKIDVHRRHDTGETLMPLRPTLLELWEGAKLLTNIDPNDDGYMTRIL